MPSPLLARRRAERFARLLDEAGGGPRHHGRCPHDPELTELVTLRGQIRATAPELQVDVDQDFRTSLRAMLVATAERDGIGATDSTTPATTGARWLGLRSRGPRARTAILAGIAVGTITFAGMSQASDSAVPGDALYGLKRSTERAQLALANSDLGRGQLYFDFARARAEEANRVSPGLEPTLADMDRDTVRGARLLTGAATERNDPAVLDAIDEFVAGQRAILDHLADQVGGQDLVRLESSRQLLDRIERRTQQARRDLLCADNAAAGVDLSDPGLADCGVSLPPAGGPGSPNQPAPQRTPTSADYTSPGSTTDGGATAAPTPAPDPTTVPPPPSSRSPVTALPSSAVPPTAAATPTSPPAVPRSPAIPSADPEPSPPSDTPDPTEETGGGGDSLPD